MTSAADTYTWAAEEAPLKAYLGVVGSAEDANLTLWLASAAEDCDDYVGHDWTDTAGDPIVHPSRIKLGVYEWIKAFRAWYQRQASAGITDVKTGQLSEKYRNSDGAEIARRVAHELWQASVYDITRLGVGYA